MEKLQIGIFNTLSETYSHTLTYKCVRGALNRHFCQNHFESHLEFKINSCQL